MRIDVITIFPELFEAFRETSLVGVACREGILELRVHDLREWTRDRHRSVDDAPYGGGPGMGLRPGPLVEAIEALAGAKGDGRTARVVLLSPQGRRLDQAGVEALAEHARLVLVCGRYEGVDQRVIELAVDEEVSIGDYVLAGGELPALVLCEAGARLLAGGVGDPASGRTGAVQGRGGGGGGGPQETRPRPLPGRAVPA